MTTELTLQQAAKYNRNRTAADHELIYRMAAVLGTTRYVEQTGSSFMKGVACMDAEGVQRMFVAAGRAYVHHLDDEPLLVAAGIRVVQGVTEDQRVVLFSNAGGVASVGSRSQQAPARPSCPTCWMELPASGICDNC